MVVVIDVRPLSAALSVLMPLVIESSRLVSSPARADRAAAVKKFVGLSSAELTFLPVARRCWVVACSSVVFCRASRFERTAAERVTEEDMLQNLSGRVPYWQMRGPIIRIGVDHIGRRAAVMTSSSVTAGKKTWLIKL